MAEQSWVGANGNFLGASVSTRRTGTLKAKKRKYMNGPNCRNTKTFTNASINENIAMILIQWSFCILSRAKWLKLHLFALQPGP
jgi:hypothetical protein